MWAGLAVRQTMWHHLSRYQVNLCLHRGPLEEPASPAAFAFCCFPTFERNIIFLISLVSQKGAWKYFYPFHDSNLHLNK